MKAELKLGFAAWLSLVSFFFSVTLSVPHTHDHTCRSCALQDIFSQLLSNYLSLKEHWAEQKAFWHEKRTG